MISFANGIFFTALLAIPALTAIYLLFRRSRPVIVSSLFLWENQLKSHRQGMTLKKLPLPLTYFIEVLIIILLVTAAAGPLLPRRQEALPLTLVMDNSFSMRAGETLSPQTAARKEIDSLVKSFPGRKFRIILAGASPRNLGEFEDKELNHVLRQWTCEESSGDLQQAAAMAKRLDQQLSTVMVYTDRRPEMTVPPGITWNARGKAVSNTAIVNASRSSGGGKDRCLAVIANIGASPCETVLRITQPGKPQPLQTQNLRLAPMEEKKITVQLPSGTGPVELNISSDALDFDNSVTLLPEHQPMLRTAIAISDAVLAADIRKALDSSGKISFTEQSPQLTITDSQHKAKAGSWSGCRVVLHNSPPARSLVGPFTINRNYPLTAGLELNGVIWGASKDADLPGAPLITAGETVLVSSVRHNPSAWEILINFVPSGSTLQNTPAWPVLFWNLADWVGNTRAGLLRNNFRTGEKITVNIPADCSKITLTGPDNLPVNLPVTQGIRQFGAAIPGGYDMTIGDRHYQYQVNPLNFQESDLRGCAYVTERGPVQPEAVARNYVNIVWVPLLAALLCLALHQYLIRRRSPQ